MIEKGKLVLVVVDVLVLGVLYIVVEVIGVFKDKGDECIEFKVICKLNKGFICVVGSCLYFFFDLVEFVK